MTSAARFLLSLLGVAMIGSGLEAQSCSAFDIASVKLNTNGGGINPELAPGGRRFTATNQYMFALLMFAYDVSPLQVSGFPSALTGQRFDIEATCDRPMTNEQLPALLRGLLAERFHLSVHRELKEQPVYALIQAKGGPKLHKPADYDAKPDLRQNGHSFRFINAPMSSLVSVLSQVTGRKVLDKTGIGGQYDFTLSYSPENSGAGRDGSTSPLADGFPTSVFTALREQLGLDLEGQKSQIEFLIIDRLDPLIPN